MRIRDLKISANSAEAYAQSKNEMLYDWRTLANLTKECA